MREKSTSQRKARPIIFLIEEDDDARPSITANLRRHGYRVLVVADKEDAREWASSGHIRADLMLVNLVRVTPEEALRLGRELRDHTRCDGNIPLVVMPEKVPGELEGTDVNVSGNDWICYYNDDSDQLQTLLARLLGKSSGQDTTRFRP